MKKSIFAIITLVALFSCSKKDTNPPPTADFAYTGANAPAPATVKFSSYAPINGSTFTWDFGDNGYSVDANPEHNYSSGGVYTVKLTVKGPGGSATSSKTVNIGAALTKVKISKVTVVNIPFTKPGGTAGWDTDGTGPDIYFKIINSNNTVLFDATASNRINDITPSSLPISWNFSTPFEITDLSSAQFIDLWDYDLITNDESMSYVGFKMSDYTTGANAYPPTVTKTQNGITVTLNLTWY